MNRFEQMIMSERGVITDAETAICDKLAQLECDLELYEPLIQRLRLLGSQDYKELRAVLSGKFELVGKFTSLLKALCLTTASKNASHLPQRSSGLDDV